MNFIVFMKGYYDDHSFDQMYSTQPNITEGSWWEFLVAHEEGVEQFAHERALEMFPELVGLEPEHYNISRENSEYWDAVDSLPSAREKFIKMHNLVEVDCVVLSE